MTSRASSLRFFRTSHRGESWRNEEDRQKGEEYLEGEGKSPGHAVRRDERHAVVDPLRSHIADLVEGQLKYHNMTSVLCRYYF